MKKAGAWLVLAVMLAGILSIVPVKAADADDPNTVIENQLGINPESIQDPEAIRDEYLKKEWATVIREQPIIGPLHTYFENHPFIFIFLLNKPYELSLKFLLVLITWLMIMTITSDFLSRGKLLPVLPGLLIGLGLAIILAQLEIVEKIASGIIIFTTSEDWTWRIIRWVLLIAFMGLLYYAEQYTAITLRKGKETTEKQHEHQQVKELKQLEKGLQEGAQIAGKNDPEWQRTSTGWKKTYK